MEGFISLCGHEVGKNASMHITCHLSIKKSIKNIFPRLPFPLFNAWKSGLGLKRSLSNHSKNLVLLLLSWRYKETCVI